MKLNENFTYFGNISHPCAIIEPNVNQKQFRIVHIFSNVSGLFSHGCGFSQLPGDNLKC